MRVLSRFRARSRKQALLFQILDQQRGLLGKFERSAGDDTYRRDEGFFEKLKSAFR